MKKLAIIFAAIAVLAGCEMLERATFENRDYYKADDTVNHPNSSPCLDYLILEFNDGVVTLKEGYYNSNSPKKWSEKKYIMFGNTLDNNPLYSEKHSGTYVRNGDEIAIKGLKATSATGAYIKFTNATIRGEKAGTLNIDAYYEAKTVRGKEQSGKLNFIGMQY